MTEVTPHPLKTQGFHHFFILLFYDHPANDVTIMKEGHPETGTPLFWWVRLELNQQMPVSETGALTIWRHPSILAGIGRLEHPRAVLGTAVLPVKLYPCMMMVMPAGFEPSITSLRGLRPNQLDEGTRWRYGSDSNRRLTALQAVLFNLLSTISWLG